MSGLLVVLGLALMAAVVAMPAKPIAADQRLLISGTVEVVEVDLHGDPKLVELVSPELGRFRVAPDRSGRKLLQHVGRWVSVFGSVEMENGQRVLHVDGFRPLALFSDGEPQARN